MTIPNSESARFALPIRTRSKPGPDAGFAAQTGLSERAAAPPGPGQSRLLQPPAVPAERRRVIRGLLLHPASRLPIHFQTPGYAPVCGKIAALGTAGVLTHDPLQGGVHHAPVIR